MSETLEETSFRAVSRINGHLREADQTAETLEARTSSDYVRTPEFYLQKAEVKTQIGLLLEARRANDLKELELLVSIYHDAPDEFFELKNAPSDLVERIEERILTRLKKVFDRG